MKIIAHGAEAIIYEDRNEIIKYREKKGYRIDEIDSDLRKSRTKREFTILKRCAENGMHVPKPINISDNGESIRMEKIEGVQLDYCFSLDLLEKVGNMLANLHKIGIVHGDLTTANMLVREKNLFFIDFGLSYFSQKDEDRATDLFLFKNALKSRHPNEFIEAYGLFLSAYKAAAGKEFKGIETHLRDIERRGRYHENG
ncbi:MAG: Kae1-associated serine/threonine protein kinase [Candidatus Parvarchaeota archaeon]|jgi:TP53 regulating kinase-like protein|nr:Kae1-associated serine/threonine protein kinase [Candidatus Parvarchaeota archaeon]MCL5101471.1 Kae1-associated serine/threonine protein kinase [Candidatus Parvarchaeota archaeon]